MASSISDSGALGPTTEEIALSFFMLRRPDRYGLSFDRWRIPVENYMHSNIMRELVAIEQDLRKEDDIMDGIHNMVAELLPLPNTFDGLHIFTELLRNSELESDFSDEDNITWEGIVKVLLVMALVADKHYLNGNATHMRMIIEWTVEFFQSASIEEWIQERGGWSKGCAQSETKLQEPHRPTSDSQKLPAQYSEWAVPESGQPMQQSQLSAQHLPISMANQPTVSPTTQQTSSEASQPEQSPKVRSPSDDEAERFGLGISTIDVLTTFVVRSSVGQHGLTNLDERFPGLTDLTDSTVMAALVALEGDFLDDVMSQQAIEQATDLIMDSPGKMPHDPADFAQKLYFSQMETWDINELTWDKIVMFLLIVDDILCGLANRTTARNYGSSQIIRWAADFFQNYSIDDWIDSQGGWEKITYMAGAIGVPKTFDSLPKSALPECSPQQKEHRPIDSSSKVRNAGVNEPTSVYYERPPSLLRKSNATISESTKKQFQSSPSPQCSPTMPLSNTTAPGHHSPTIKLQQSQTPPSSSQPSTPQNLYHNPPILPKSPLRIHDYMQAFVTPQNKPIFKSPSSESTSLSSSSWGSPNRDSSDRRDADEDVLLIRPIDPALPLAPSTRNQNYQGLQKPITSPMPSLKMSEYSPGLTTQNQLPSQASFTQPVTSSASSYGRPDLRYPVRPMMDENMPQDNPTSPYVPKSLPYEKRSGRSFSPISERLKQQSPIVHTAVQQPPGYPSARPLVPAVSPIVSINISIPMPGFVVPGNPPMFEASAAHTANEFFSRCGAQSLSSSQRQAQLMGPQSLPPPQNLNDQRMPMVTISSTLPVQIPIYSTGYVNPPNQLLPQTLALEYANNSSSYFGSPNLRRCTTDDELKVYPISPPTSRHSTRAQSPRQTVSPIAASPDRQSPIVHSPTQHSLRYSSPTRDRNIQSPTRQPPRQ